MNLPNARKGPYPTAAEGVKAAKHHVDSLQTRSASYRLAFQDDELKRIFDQFS